MENSNTTLLIIVIGIALIAIVHFKQNEKFTIEHLSTPTTNSDTLYNNAVTSVGTKAVNNVIDNITNKITNTTNNTSLNNLFTDNLKGTSSPVNVTGIIPDKLNSASTPDTAGILTPELSALAKTNDKNQKLVSKDLLPKEKKDNWFADIPAPVTLDDANMNAYYITLPMIGQSRRNSSYDIRSGLPVPKFSVSPFNNSSYDQVIQNGTLC